MDSKFEKDFIELLETEHQKSEEAERNAAMLDKVIGVQPWNIKTPVCETMLPQRTLPEWFT